MIDTTVSDLFSLEKRSFFHSISRAYCEQLWAEHQYLVMLHSDRHYQEIAESFRHKATGEGDWSAFAETLLAQIAESSAIAITPDRARNALSHAFGHVREHLTATQRDHWLELVQTDWQDAWRCLFTFAMQYGNADLQRSRLFAPEAPPGDVWVAVQGECWFVRHVHGIWTVQSPVEVKQELGDHKVGSLLEYRLLAKLNDSIELLDSYDELFHHQAVPKTAAEAAGASITRPSAQQPELISEALETTKGGE